MDELLKIGINTGLVYSKNVCLKWIVPGVVHLIINNKYLKFDFDENCFKLEEKPIYFLSIENQTIPCCVDTYATRESCSIDSLNLGRYQSIVFDDNAILAQHRNTRPEGKVLGIIESTGIYKPEAKLFDDDQNRFDCLKFVTGGRNSRIWKVR